jgi:hypothetical protein
MRALSRMMDIMSFAECPSQKGVAPWICRSTGDPLNGFARFLRMLNRVLVWKRQYSGLGCQQAAPFAAIWNADSWTAPQEQRSCNRRYLRGLHQDPHH